MIQTTLDEDRSPLSSDDGIGKIQFILVVDSIFEEKKKYKWLDGD